QQIFAQRFAADNRAAADQAWKGFYPNFLRAVKRRDRTTLRTMMVPQFWYSFGGNTDRDEAFEYYDKPYVRGWTALERILAKGVTKTAMGESLIDGSPVLSRVAPPAAKRRSYTDWRAYFEYGKDGRWLWTGFIAGD
ncbi:MAG: hypothetical protein ACRD6N_12570, partial [Pyrinomonadaceae bacterium]